MLLLAVCLVRFLAVLHVCTITVVASNRSCVCLCLMLLLAVILGLDRLGVLRLCGRRRRSDGRSSSLVTLGEAVGGGCSDGVVRGRRLGVVTVVGLANGGSQGGVGRGVTLRVCGGVSDGGSVVVVAAGGVVLLSLLVVL